nr:immunoglobulin light chain junction region [Macaca mulatta]MPN65275.1 immunoglobulin light chain junction region [Macaca mulatta]MPN65293.1 immunoglobulin light chain junction region [Macaca mulatta]MPN65351.1 immunoglobulin light chain junction region [Macaca mulatta]MPN65386.1 immunoglobulin light chain junction region [Macaca mulatta]
CQVWDISSDHGLF